MATPTAPSTSAPTRAPTRAPSPALAASARRLGRAVGVLVGLDAAGGAVAIAAGINPPRDAWGSRARLAAPWPMIATQVGLVLVARRARPVVARRAAGALGLACGVSAASGFLDGGLGAPGLTRRHGVLQGVLVAWTAVTGLLAVAHLRRLGRHVTPSRAAGR